MVMQQNQNRDTRHKRNDVRMIVDFVSRLPVGEQMEIIGKMVSTVAGEVGFNSRVPFDHRVAASQALIKRMAASARLAAIPRAAY